MWYEMAISTSRRVNGKSNDLSGVKTKNTFCFVHAYNTDKLTTHCVSWLETCTRRSGDFVFLNALSTSNESQVHQVIEGMFWSACIDVFLCASIAALLGRARGLILLPKGWGTRRHSV